MLRFDAVLDGVHRTHDRQGITRLIRRLFEKIDNRIRFVMCLVRSQHEHYPGPKLAHAILADHDPDLARGELDEGPGRVNPERLNELLYKFGLKARIALPVKLLERCVRGNRGGM